MLTGFNTDVHHDDRTFHVQTEDRGAGNPIIETLIYEGGRILDARRRDYRTEAGNGMGEGRLSTLLERQHQNVVRDIRLGKYDPPERRKPLGAGVISDRGLEEVVKDFIEEAAEAGTLPPPHGGKRSP
jgi:hypothetical protein